MKSQKVTRLDSSTEAKLLREAKKGGQALDTLYRHYEYIVRLTVARCVPRPPWGIEVDDLLQVAAIGLATAIRKYDPERGVTFVTYAITCTRGSILEYLRSVDRVSRKTRVALRTQARQDDEIRVQLGGEEGDDLTRAGLIGLTLDQYYQSRVAEPMVEVSLFDLLRRTGWDGVETETNLAHLPSSDLLPEEVLVQNDQTDVLTKLIGQLPERERKTLIAYYWGGRTLGVIAQTLGVSAARAHQLRDQGLKRIKKGLEGVGRWA